jgi:hypothetical protein
MSIHPFAAQNVRVVVELSGSCRIFIHTYYMYNIAMWITARNVSMP